MLNYPALHPDHAYRLALACILLGLYLLVYTPQINSADGEAILAVTASTIRHGVPDIGVIGAGDALLPFEMSRMGSFGLDGAYYSKKGVTPSVALAPLVILSEALPWLDTRATAMLFNPLVTTLTALGLYTLARWLGFRPRTAFITAFLYGTATFAMTYVKTLFGEPLAALLLLGAVMGVYRYRLSGRWRWMTGVGLCLGLLIGVNLVYAAIIPVVGLAVFLPGAWAALRDQKNRRRLIRDTAAFALPILILLALLAVYNGARFGSPTNTGYHFDSGEGFNKPLLDGIYGLTIGPYRGLFWYSPLLLLAVPGWLMLRRVSSWLAWLALALVGLQILSFASWWSWDGGIVWGPRFLLTVTPLLALCLAPIVEAAWKKRPIAFALLGFTGLSLFVQFLGAAYSIYPYISYLWEYYYDTNLSRLPPEVFWNPGLSAVLGHLALAVDGWPLEPAWATNGIDYVHLILAGALVIGGATIAFWDAARQRFVALMMLIMIVLCLNLVAARQQKGEAFHAIQSLEAALNPPGRVLVASTLFGESLVDVEGRPWLLSTNAPTTPDDPLAAPMTEFALRGDNVWLVTWFRPADPANWQERDLWQRGAFAYEREAAGHRALLFNLTPTTPNQPAGHHFGPIRLEQYGIEPVSNGVIVSVEWSAFEPPDGDYQWFIHLLDADRQIIAQQDRPPLGGYQPTSTWTPDRKVIDRLFFPDLTAPVTLRIGWLDPITGDLLPAAAPDGTPLTDGFALLQSPES